MKHYLAIGPLLGLAACVDGASDPRASSVPLSQPIPAICTPQEAPIFACTLDNGKQLSVCGQEGGGAQYRFGDADGAELVLEDGVWASVAYSGGGAAQIKFDNADTSYIVFSQVFRTNFAAGEPNNPAISDGVVVLEGGRPIVQYICEGPDLKPIDYNKAQNLLPRADTLFTETEM